VKLSEKNEKQISSKVKLTRLKTDSQESNHFCTFTFAKPKYSVFFLAKTFIQIINSHGNCSQVLSKNRQVQGNLKSIRKKVKRNWLL
jgi:hypothetical protein